MNTRFALCALFTLAAAPLAAQEQAHRYPTDARTIQVTGAGEVRVAPDLALVSFAVETRAESAREAGEENARRMERVIRALVAAGVDRTDLETSGYRVYPVYARPSRGQEPRVEGYRVTNQVTLRTGQLDELGRYIDQALGAGANRMHGIRFELDDQHAASVEALRRAAERAAVSARALATTLGVRLGQLRHASTSVSRPVFPYARAMARDLMAAAEAAPETPIEPEEQTVTATVNVIFDIEGR
ncbi:MAG: SIMPL domain-containing protein [Longimicrobiaceae bacterium]